MKKILLVFAAVFYCTFQAYSASNDYLHTANLHATEPAPTEITAESYLHTPQTEETPSTSPMAATTAFSKHNYISTYIYNSAEGNIGYWKIQFLDGLGSPLEDVYVNYAPASKHLITLYEYDSNGRPNITWLPIATTSVEKDFFVEPSYIKSQARNYYNDTTPYQEVVYKNDPLDQVYKEFNAGSLFRTQSKFVHTEKRGNMANEVRKIIINERENYMDVSQFYTTNTLLVTISTDEDGVQTSTYTNRSGQVVMTSVNNAKTYYGYNARGLQTIVITPEGSSYLNPTDILYQTEAESIDAGLPLDIYKQATTTDDVNIPNDSISRLTPVAISTNSLDLTNIALNSAFVNAYCYKYRYDGRGNLTERKLPGRALEEMEYNEQGLLSTHFRGKLDATKTIEYADHFKYDSLNRLTSISQATYAVSGSNRFPTPTSIPMLNIQYDNYDDVPYELSYRVFRGFSDIIIDAWRTKGLTTYEKLRVINQVDKTAGYVERAYYYDSHGHIIQKVERNHLGGISYFNYAYDFLGNIILRREQIQATPDSEANILTVECTFDNTGRPINETYTIGDNEPVEVSYGYNALAQMVTKKTGPNSERYIYNMQGWLIGQISPTYSAALRYYNPSLGTQASYTGNISEWEWSNTDDGDQYTYAYSYSSSRLTNAELYVNNTLSNINTEKNIRYDLNGNITSMTRKMAGSPDEEMDYVYQSGILRTVSDQAYFYDNCGNTTHDGRNNLDIKYNFLNLPMQIQSRSTGEQLNYCYLTDGTKFSTHSADGTGLLYIGSFVFKETNGNIVPESCAFNGGRFVATTTSTGLTYTPQYYITDHLGSVRVITDETGDPIATNQYLPSGKRWESSSEAISSDRYRFNGKEEQWIANSGLLDYGARFYNPDIARWLTQDPLAEKYYNISPYTYCAGNPTNYVDLLGLDIYRYDYKTGKMTRMIENDDEYDQVGKFKYNKETGTYTLKTNKKGEARILIDNIEKGILHDGIDFKNEDNVVNVGAPGQASVKGFESFIVDFSDMIDKEIAGYYLSEKGNEKGGIRHIYIGKTIHNTSIHGEVIIPSKITSNKPDLKNTTIEVHFHTHLTRHDNFYRHHASPTDLNTRIDIAKKFPELKIKYKILTGGIGGSIDEILY